MPDKNTVFIASRALSLYLFFWGFGNLANVPLLIFSLIHYAALPATGASYLYQSNVISLTSHLVVSGALFLGAGWCYRGVPRIQVFLCPPENKPDNFGSPPTTELP